MSFYVKFNARSRPHALRLLELNAAQLPTPVLSFLKSSIENIPSVRDVTRVVQV